MAGVRLRDFIVTHEGMIFAVVSYVHPPQRYLAFLRYYPSNHGERRGYCKVASTEQSFHYLQEHFPEYILSHAGARLQAVPSSRVEKVLSPRERLAEILEKPGDSLEAKTAELAEVFSGVVPASRLGVTGSLLARLHLPASDIDLVIYGRENHRRARALLAELIEEGDAHIQELTLAEWRRAYEKRFPGEKTLSFPDFLWHERRKFHKASFKGTTFDLLLVRERCDESWGKESYTHLGMAEVNCAVEDASLAFDYPARYAVSCSDEGVEEIVAYSHTYAGQAFEGERILARGRLEEVVSRRRSYLRLVVGTTREAEGEYIRVVG
ncbi:nucleotidyltransferase domain-containing protein [Candidatus Pyrohabitans sp.]